MMPTVQKWISYLRELRDAGHLTDYGRGQLAGYEIARRYVRDSGSWWKDPCECDECECDCLSLSPPLCSACQRDDHEPHRALPAASDLRGLAKDTPGWGDGMRAEHETE